MFYFCIRFGVAIKLTDPTEILLAGDVECIFEWVVTSVLNRPAALNFCCENEGVLIFYKVLRFHDRKTIKFHVQKRCSVDGI